MKNYYRCLSMMTIAFLMAIIPFSSQAQDKVYETNAKPNAAPCYNYWSVGVFGGVMQFNGDLSRTLWTNLGPNSAGYNVGFVAAKQFTRVIGVRARIAYGMLQSRAENKFSFESRGVIGVPGYISQSFQTTIFESDLQLTVNWTNWILGYKPGRLFSSYLIAGFGMDQAKGTKRDINLNQEIAYLGKGGKDMNVGNTNGMGGSDLQFKLDAGIGFDFNINKHFSIPVEFSLRWQNSDNLDMTRGGSEQVFADMYSSATVGLTYKFGYKCPKIKEEVAFIVPPPLVMPDPTVRFSVIAPRHIPAERIVREKFPLRNYVFFNAGSTDIPDRYVLLTKGQVKDFKEDQLEMFVPKNLSGRSSRQMVVYYNILNILGDRMWKNPSATVRLTGASMEGPEDGKAMAESIKRYLIDIFGIDASRITSEGRVKPGIPSEQPGGTKELDLLREGDRRVSIWSASPALLMEFQSGDDARLKPVEIVTMQQAPLDSYVFFNVEGGKTAFTSWSLEIRDDQGNVQNFGPFTEDRMNMPGKSILGVRPEGKYRITMIGLAKNGNTIKKDTTVNMVLWAPPKNEETMRFSVIYEFNESKTIPLYEKYLTDIVLPKIPTGGTVIIHGYTDVIGDEDYNRKLSLDRANDVKTIMENGLAKAGRSDVRFEVYGFGEDEKLSPFENKFPEERFYNRTVIIDIIPTQ
jgi:outer membrane protein OmpA-like peptidoglycan-associated protein